MRYFDSSVLLKLYLSEPQTTTAIRLFRDAQTSPPFTRLHGVEIRGAFQQKCGRGELSQGECAQLIAILESDLQSAVFTQPVVQWNETFDRAETLTAAHASETLCRTLDVLHVATAVALGADEFCTFDHRQAAMASAAGLNLVTE